MLYSSARIAMSKLTTHVLDTASGLPASGMRLQLLRADDLALPPLADLRTNADGRCDAPLLQGASFIVGRYILRFFVAEYFRAAGARLDEPPFLDLVEIAFGIADATKHYHVPLLVTPWSYSTYRGS
jgi:5-hydroxyisourate hydrolase